MSICCGPGSADTASPVELYVLEDDELEVISKEKDSPAPATSIAARPAAPPFSSSSPPSNASSNARASISNAKAWADSLPADDSSLPAALTVMDDDIDVIVVIADADCVPCASVDAGATGAVCVGITPTG